MSPTSEPAPAKLNLALHVRGRRPDGYHALETLYAFAAVGDRVMVEGPGAPGLTLAGDFAGDLDAGGDNLAVRAAEAFAEEFADDRGGEVPPLRLLKDLPVAGGLGGGSADAAAVLRLLARRLDGVDPDRLMVLAAALGADVPACVLSRACRGEGRGDELTPVDGSALTGRPVVLAKPGVKLSTAEVFAAWDGQDRGALPTGDPMTVAREGRNDLEPAAIALVPSIGELLDHLSRQPGVILARMSGSGASCFALCESDEAARRVATAAAERDRAAWVRATVLL